MVSNSRLRRPAATVLLTAGGKLLLPSDPPAPEPPFVIPLNKEQMNTDRFLAEQKRYFTGSYEEFCSFGGPCVYFHDECLRAATEGFLSRRHVEMLYATLTAWGMHRMGDPKTTKTKLTDWDCFNESILAQSDVLQQFRSHRMLEMSATEYADTVLALRPIYRRFKLSVSNATVVVNSKALFHLFPEFIPPIDRQYTVRFFKQTPERWRDRKGKFQAVSLPAGLAEQFELFREICISMKRLADRIEPGIFEQERRQHRVTAPKALDNAIVNFVTIVSG